MNENVSTRNAKTLAEVQLMMDRTMGEFVGELIDHITIEHIRHLMIDRFNRDFIMEHKADYGGLSLTIMNGGSEIRARFHVVFKYPLWEFGTVVSSAGR